jgi:hypothetical protein
LQELELDIMCVLLLDKMRVLLELGLDELELDELGLSLSIYFINTMPEPPLAPAVLAPFHAAPPPPPPVLAIPTTGVLRGTLGSDLLPPRPPPPLPPVPATPYGSVS